MTEQELADIEARANAATRGPWVHLTNDPFWGQIRSCGDSPDDPTAFSFVADTPAGDEREKDMEFIASAREDVPALVTEVRRLKALVGEE